MITTTSHHIQPDLDLHGPQEAKEAASFDCLDDSIIVGAVLVTSH
jgi:hypothetical protein